MRLFKLFHKFTVHIRPGKIFYWKKVSTVEVTIYSYYKCMPKSEAIN